MPLAPGTQLGPYEITAPLGAGGMGEVYRARDTRLDRAVAIKILPQEMSGDPLRKQRFEREAKTISSLNHPNICVLHDVGSQDGLSYLVMECLEGETLAKRLEKGPLPLELALKYGAQIADALDKAHRGGVVHRDLKPGNIMLTSTGAKLLDFGLAKPAVTLATAATLTVTTPSSPVTEQGTIVGTFQYMSPEQVEGKELDGRSDIFSLGAVLYEMVTGKRAFEGKSQLSVASAILEKEPAPIATIKPMTPPALDHTIRRCLTKAPERRWQSAGDVARELEWIAEGETEASKAGPGARRKAPVLEFAALAVLLVFIGVFGGVYLRRPAPIGTTVRASILPPEDAEFFTLDIEGGAPVVSPDGKLLASSVRDKKGIVQLWLWSIHSQGGQFLPGTEGAGHPFWSPESKSIGFFAKGKLKRIDTDGTSLQTLCDVSVSPRGGSWSRDGVILFTPGVAGALRKVPANGGASTAASELDTKRESGHRWPQFLPDSKHYIFFVRSFDREQTGIYEGSLDSKEHHMVLRTGYQAVHVPQGYLLYMREQTLMAQAFDAEKGTLTGEPFSLPDRVAFVSTNSDAMFSASDNGVLAYYPSLNAAMGWELVWYDRAGKKLSSIGKDFFSVPTISPDGTKVAVAIYDKDWWTPDLWVLDTARGTRTRLTFGNGPAGSPVWEPDGQALLFGLTQNGQQHIFRKSLTGTGAPEVVLQTDRTIESPRSICRDGRYLVYARAEVGGNGKFAVWILPMFGDRKPFPLVEGQFDAYNPRISPNCKWVAYLSAEPGQPQIYITSFPDGKRKYQATTAGGDNPRWRGDGKELFFMSPEGNLEAVGVEEAGQELKLGSPRLLFAAHGIAIRLGPYDARLDGQRFLVNGNPEPIRGTPLTLVVNWDAELKKK